MLPSNRRQERLRKRLSMYRMHHKACLMMHQNCSASELCLVKPGIRPSAAVATSDCHSRASSTAKRRHRKLQVPNQSSSSWNRNKNPGPQSQVVNRGRMPCDQMSASNALSNMLANSSFTHRQSDDLDFVDNLEYLLNFGSGVTVLPVLRDIEILDYFERIAK